jgi:outer membrane receptor protein involved in Fe transport
MMTVILLLATLAQAPSAVSGVVTDATGLAMSGVTVTATSGTVRGSARTAPDGSWSIPVPAGVTSVTLRVEASGFASERREVTLPAAEPIRFQLQPEAISEKVVVTAESSTTHLSIESSVTSLDRSMIAAAPAMRLDDQLRTVPGFSLFRRTSSSVANPTTQGVTLRGLSASGASRTLVMSDDVPLNDPFGAWVYWDRIPMAALQRVDVVRGASGDMHGNDALGGVIRISTRTTQGAEGWLEGGSLNSARGSAYGALTREGWNAGAAVESMKTDGYRVTAPEVAGPIDVNADSNSDSSLGWFGAGKGALQGVVRGGYMNESRGNGTPATVNGTVTRWAGGNVHGMLGGGVWEARGDFSSTNYRQTFSAILTVNGVARAGERLTGLQWVGGLGGGVGVSWLKQTGRAQTLFSFTDRGVKANLDEASIAVNGVQAPTTRTPARQRGDGFVIQEQFELSPSVSLDGGIRFEHWRLWRTDVTTAEHGHNFFQPRVGVAFRLSDARTVRATWLSGFRTPTMNELYRSFRVGNTNTAANDALNPEKSWGPEFAYTERHERWSARAIFYATTLDGAIYNKTLSSTPAAISRQRANGDARTIGSELEGEWRVLRTLSITSSWALNNAKFTSGDLDGKRVPQVPKATGSVGFRGSCGPLTGGLNVRIIGEQFDDDINQFVLRHANVVDGRAGWRFHRRFELFGALENAFDEDVDTGRTPLRTVGAPRQGRVGVIVRY